MIHEATTVIYKGQKLKYIPDFIGNEVLWATNEDQKHLSHMSVVGAYPDEYCIFMNELLWSEVLDIYKQVSAKGNLCR